MTHQSNEENKSILYYIFKTARPRQWIKNCALYASLIFSGFFFFQPAEGAAYFWVVTFAFGIFCLLASSVYIINDILDYEADRNHPFKKTTGCLRKASYSRGYFCSAYTPHCCFSTFDVATHFF
jgi:4-hydroxybenzoate polyprenyltransferase